MTGDGEKIGSVSASRYAVIVAELRTLVETASRIQFAIGDYALEVEPMREYGGQEKGEAPFTVKESLVRLAEDIGVSYSMGSQTRWTASRWPKERRVAGVSYTVTGSWRGLRTRRSGSRRSALHLRGSRGGRRTRRTGGWAVRWSGPSRRRRRSARSTLAKDEEVAATVTGDLLRRPAVVAQDKPADKVKVVEELTWDESVAAEVDEHARRLSTVNLGIPTITGHDTVPRQPPPPKTDS